MFSLIISIIAISLVASLSLASIYYGGTAFQKGIQESTATTLINQAQQIQGAFSLANSDNFDYDNATNSDLVDRLVEGGFLKSAPQLEGNLWSGFNIDGSMQVDDKDAKVIVMAGLKAAVCDEVEQMLNNSFNESSTHSDIGDNHYGCDSTGNVYFKL